MLARISRAHPRNVARHGTSCGPLLQISIFSSSPRVVRFATAVLCLVLGMSAGAHPEIEDALIRLNARIAAQPADADLYVTRGELYARHEEWVVTEANYLRAAELAPDHPRLPLLRGALELATGRPSEARKHLDLAFGRDPKNPEVLVLRARAKRALADRVGAIEDFNAALALTSTVHPELYLERAKLLPPGEALQSLDEGLARIGPALTLHLAALALEQSLGRIDAAVARIDRLAAESERKEAWLKRRGDLLLTAGRASEARASYVSALVALQALPEWLRTSPDSLQLAAELKRLTSSRS